MISSQKVILSQSYTDGGQSGPQCAKPHAKAQWGQQLEVYTILYGEIESVYLALGSWT